MIVMLWQQAGYMMIIYISGLTSIPGELIEAAEMDGANGWQVLTATFDLDKVEENRMSWGVFRDRRPEWYGEITRQGRGV